MTIGRERSSRDFAHAKTVIPGGVNSPVRAFHKVACDPVFYDHAQGSRVWDVDGNEYRFHLLMGADDLRARRCRRAVRRARPARARRVLRRPVRGRAQARR